MRVFLFALFAAAILLQACNGASNTNTATPTPNETSYNARVSK